MSKRWVLLAVFCLLLLVTVNGYHWYKEAPKGEIEQVKQIVSLALFLLIYLILPFGIAVYLLLSNTIRWLLTRSRKKEPWEQ